MSGRTSRFGRKLAAAAVAVAGVLTLMAGTAWATGNTVSEVDKATATINFDFNFEGELEFIPHDASIKTLSSMDVISTSPTYLPVKDPGNLGALRAITNGPSWDIEFTTEHGGRLYSPGSKTSDGTPDTNQFTGVITPGTPTYNPGIFLTYSNPTTPTGDAAHSRKAGPIVDTVVLDVAIGLAAKFGASSPNPNSIYALGKQSSIDVPPTRIGITKMLGSATNPIGGVDTTNATGSHHGEPVSFAERIATDATAGSTGGGANALLAALYGFEGLGGLAATNTVGAAATTGSLGTTGFRSVSNDQYFYINAGIYPTNKDIKGEANRNFSETITFYLKAGF